MNTRLAFAVAIALLMPLSACDTGKTYPVRFVCAPGASAECPAGEECPVVPEGPGVCGDVPGVLGHPPMPIDMARPPGCQVWLPFGNPAYADDQVTCTCSTPITPGGWTCGI